MSLRKSPQLTPELLAAARQNAQHSTGPRSPTASRTGREQARGGQSGGKLPHSKASSPGRARRLVFQVILQDI